MLLKQIYVLNGPFNKYFLINRLLRFLQNANNKFRILHILNRNIFFFQNRLIKRLLYPPILKQISIRIRIATKRRNSKRIPLSLLNFALQQILISHNQAFKRAIYLNRSLFSKLRVFLYLVGFRLNLFDQLLEVKFDLANLFLLFLTWMF